MPADAAIGGRSAAAWFGAPFSAVSDPVLVVAPQGALGTGLPEIWTTVDGTRITSVERRAWDVATLETISTAV